MGAERPPSCDGGTGHLVVDVVILDQEGDVVGVDVDLGVGLD